MKFQLIKIFLWPKNGSAYREVEFTPGAVNVICGSSKAGKSAVIPIIDYCLAAEKCAIPVGTIRDTCAWFGLLVETREGQKLFARAEPGNQRSTDDMFILEGRRVSVPERIAKKNTNCTSVKDILNRLAGLPNIGFDSNVAYGFRSRPSFRDLMAFTFQPQNIVANPDVLFYKSDTTKHRDKLRDIFPFILGAVTSETLIATWEMKDLERQQKQLQSELKALFDASARLRSEARSWLFQAREYGLAPLNAVLSEDWGIAIEQLKSILAMSSRDAAPKLDTIQKTISTIGELRQREDIIAKNLYIGRQKLKELEQVKQDADVYLTSLDTLSERLSLSSWLKDLVAEGSQGEPGVLGTHLRASTELDQLCLALTNIEALAQQTPVVSTSVENELVRLRNAMRKDIEELEAIRSELKAIETLDKKAKGEALRQTDIDRYLGRLEEAVKNYTSALIDDGISKKLEAVNKKIQELAPKISVDLVRANTRRVLDALSDLCAEITPDLDAEWKDARIALSITDLAIKVRHNDRDDYLWEVGSGANWLAYHVAMLLALQKLFIRKSIEHPVPHFLVFDQPSQVYFPVKRAAKENDEQEHEWGDEDRTAVRKVFTALAAAVNESKGELQIIVLDHADEGVWGNIPGVVLTEEWRDKKLVPPSFE